MSHTPTPWKIRYAKNLTAIVTPKGEMQLSLHGVYAGLKPLSVSLQEWEGNAEFITQAVNSHQMMYEALLHIKKVLNYYPEGQFDEEVTVVNKAIAQAEGENNP